MHMLWPIVGFCAPVDHCVMHLFFSFEAGRKRGGDAAVNCGIHYALLMVLQCLPM